MRLGYKHKKEQDIIANKYWNNTILPLLNNGSLAHAVNNTYKYPNRIGLYPGLNCQFFCTFCGRNYDAKYERSIADESLEVFKKIIDQDPKTDTNWQDRFRISGGLEPLTNPHIGEIIHYGNSQGFKMQLYTNGYALTEKFVDKQLGLLDLEAMRVSLYGYNDDSYYAVTKNNKSYKMVVNNLKNFCTRMSTSDKPLRLGVNWIILPGHSNDIKKVFRMVKEINSVSDFKISFITLREDFSQSNNYISDVERSTLHNIFVDIEEDCANDDDMKDLHIDYGYALYPVRHGLIQGPLKMANYEQMDGYGFPQVATAIDSLGNQYVYHESGFLDRPGSDRYIIGNIHNNTIEDIVKKHLKGPGIKPKPFDVGFLDAFDHTITLLVDEAKKSGNNWLEKLELKWNRT